jgi:hypothetical protein
MISVDRRKFVLGLLSSSISVPVVGNWSEVPTTILSDSHFVLSPNTNIWQNVTNMPCNGPLYNGYVGEYSGGVNFLS